MTKSEKEVVKAGLEAEKAVLEALQEVYKDASADCSEAIAALAARTDMQNLQSIIYQKQYQQAVKNQIDGILNTLQTKQFDSIASYLTECYENGYVGAMYDLQSQGIPIITPIDQNQVVKAVQTDSKISKGLYTRLEEDVTSLKKNIAGEMSRGIATGSGWLEIATRIAGKMTNPFDKILSNAIRIARTEGHRIQQEAQLDALQNAKSAGADIVKQWDATLDARTRPDHQEADGQIVELDEEFTVGGEKLKAPGVGGSAKNVVNCRCCMLQRARWALDEAELETLKERAEFFGLDKAENFAEFKEKYLTATGGTVQTGGKHYIPYDDSNERDIAAAEAYRKISRSNDLKQIAENTGFSEEQIKQVKRHIFFDKHDLYDGYGLFAPDYDMAVAWNRLQNGSFLDRDILLLNHELLESTVEKAYNLDATEAHRIANKVYPWYDTMMKETGGGEPDDCL